MTKHVKWYFNIRRWLPTREDWLSLTSSIPEEELDRINRFHYQDDSKSSLIGQALIRKFVSLALDKPSNEVEITRTKHGRPVIVDDSIGDSDKKFIDFNVSHSGDYCVLAGFWNKDQQHSNLSIGVDVTKIVRKNSKQELNRFLDLMSRREFLPEEWETVQKVQEDRQKCINFTRLWCLKESFIKSIGLGLSYNLNRICFQPSDSSRYNLRPEILKGNILNDTVVSVDGTPAFHWRFLETALDDEHLVAVGYKFDSATDQSQTIDESPFEELDISSLVYGITPMRVHDESSWAHFFSRPTKKFNQI